MQNLFEYSSDNKRYHTWNYYLKNKYSSKVFKVPLNANFTCPNRDGKVAYGGCTFCGSQGSGEQVIDFYDSLQQQFESNYNVMKHKWPNGKAIAYFQAYTNTYCDLDTLKKTIEPFYYRDDVLGLAIATRADCLEDDKITYLNSLTDKKEIWIELGLQSIHDSTANFINRGHDFKTFLNCINRLKNTNLKICVHLMNSLPHETKEMMIESAKVVSQLPIHALKIHMLYISHNTKIALQHMKSPFELLSKEEYIDVVVNQLTWIPKHIIIQRLTGDGDRDSQIGSEWMFKKTIVLNDIDKEMVKRNIYQGCNIKREI